MSAAEQTPPASPLALAALRCKVAIELARRVEASSSHADAQLVELAWSQIELAFDALEVQLASLERGAWSTLPPFSDLRR